MHHLVKCWFLRTTKIKLRSEDRKNVHRLCHSTCNFSHVLYKHQFNSFIVNSYLQISQSGGPTHNSIWQCSIHNIGVIRTSNITIELPQDLFLQIAGPETALHDVAGIEDDGAAQRRAPLRDRRRALRGGLVVQGGGLLRPGIRWPAAAVSDCVGCAGERLAPCG